MASPTSLMSVWAALLGLARVQQGLTQRQLAQMAEVRQFQISLWENGAEVSLRNLIRWADALGFDVALVRREVSDAVPQ
jgi:transcriptional regulator with XRE-family HTH domain